MLQAQSLGTLPATLPLSSCRESWSGRPGATPEPAAAALKLMLIIVGVCGASLLRGEPATLLARLDRADSQPLYSDQQ